eukprot:135012-Chlamydomonas_euryale.AAC.3
MHSATVSGRRPSGSTSSVAPGRARPTIAATSTASSSGTTPPRQALVARSCSSTQRCPVSRHERAAVAAPLPLPSPSSGGPSSSARLQHSGLPMKRGEKNCRSSPSIAGLPTHTAALLRCRLNAERASGTRPPCKTRC